MQHRQQWFNAVRAIAVPAIKRAAVLCVALPLVAQAASAQFRDIYPDPSVAKTEIHAALERANAFAGSAEYFAINFSGSNPSGRYPYMK